MSKRVQVPEGYRLPEGVKPMKVKHAWTVRDVIEILSDYDPGAIVWTNAYIETLPEDQYDEAFDVIEPIQTISGSQGAVFL